LDSYGEKNAILQAVWEEVLEALARSDIKSAINRQEIYNFNGKEKIYTTEAILKNQSV
jgi:hypothetical protein